MTTHLRDCFAKAYGSFLLGLQLLEFILKRAQLAVPLLEAVEGK